MRQIGLLFYLLIFMKSSNCAQKVRCKSALARQGLGSSENELYGFLSRITPSDDLKNQAIKNEQEIYYCNKIGNYDPNSNFPPKLKWLFLKYYPSDDDLTNSNSF